MRMGGFKTPEELEAYGEDNFFRDYPQARQMAKGGSLPEAFPQIATAANFFNYGVPVPPTYYSHGGSLTNRMVYPQIQSEEQFFSPVYSNSNNAYAKGGNIEEFPQAQRYPQGGWGKTNYFMLQDGGTFPPGMPQYTGMLPVVESGASIAGVMDRTIDDNYHYGVKPMQDGGQPNMTPDNPALARLQKFVGQIQSLGQKNLLKELTPQGEEMMEPGARYGGHPVMKAQRGIAVPNLGGNSSVPSNDPYMEALRQQYNAMTATRTPEQDQQILQQRETAKNAQAMGWGNNVQGYIDSGYNYGPPAVKTGEEKKKPNTKTQAGVSKIFEPVTVTPSTTPSNSGTTTTTVAPTTGTASAPVIPGTASTHAATTADGTTSTTGAATPPPGWMKTTDPWGREGYINPETNEMYYNESNFGRGNRSYGNPNLQYYDNYGYSNPWVIPGGWKPGRFDTRGQAEDLLYLAAQGLLTPEHVKNVDFEQATRKALFKKNRTPYIKHVSFDLEGRKPMFPITQLETEQTKPVSVMPGMTSIDVSPDNYRSSSKGPTLSPDTPYNGVEVNTDESIMEGMRRGGPFALPMYITGGPGSILDEDVPYEGTEVMIQENPEQNIMWNTGVNDQLNKVAREIESDKWNKKIGFTPGKQKRDRTSPEFDLMAGSFLTKFFNNVLPGNQNSQDFNSALNRYGIARKPADRGDYLANDPGVGNTFRPDQYNPNMHGMYAPDYGYSQMGGQQMADINSDQYYLTQEQINKVIRAGGRVPGF